MNFASWGEWYGESPFFLSRGVHHLTAIARYVFELFHPLIKAFLGGTLDMHRPGDYRVIWIHVTYLTTTITWIMCEGVPEVGNLLGSVLLAGSCSHGPMVLCNWIIHLVKGCCWRDSVRCTRRDAQQSRVSNILKFCQNGIIFLYNISKYVFLNEAVWILKKSLKYVSGSTLTDTALLVLVSLQWCHYERDGASKHRRLDCLLKRLFRRRSKKTSKLRVAGQGPVNVPHKGPVTRKMFPFADVTMLMPIGSWTNENQDPWRHMVCFTAP